MKILIVSTYDSGGAANACRRLHEGLLGQGVASKLLVLHKTKEIKEGYEFSAQNQKTHPLFKFLKKVKHKIGKKYHLEFLKTNVSKEELFIKRREQGLELYSFPNSIHDITASKLYKEADVINLHWVAGFLDYESFFKKNKKPVIWTLHDMNPFTGGEHYVEINYGIGKEGIPLKRNFSKLENDYSERNLKMKLKALINFIPLSIISPSRWLQEEAQDSLLFKNRVVNLVPYGMDVQNFTCRDVNFSRELFNIPLDKKVILFVADSVANQRKGYVYLKRALEDLNREDVLLCSIGKGQPDLNTTIESRHLGQIGDERIISAIYSLADVFVIPSLMDNLPNTVLESLLCGTPVIGFPVGGIPDMIEHKRNGLLTSEVSVDALKKSIEYFLHSGVSSSREQIREQAVKKYDQSVQANKYLQIFKEALNNNPN
jgi:glycosyltransferase involved in cell wall biosynthesis